jgi:hypothetical protein
MYILHQTHDCSGLCGVAQVSNCKIGKENMTPLLVADGASARIDVETCAIRVSRSLSEGHLGPTRSCFQVIPGHSASKVSDALKSILSCDHISFSSPLVHHNMKRRMSAGSIISLCEITEDSPCVISDSFTAHFPHLPEPAAAATAEIEKEIIHP